MFTSTYQTKLIAKMFKIINTVANRTLFKVKNFAELKNIRTFLSQAYYCQEVWDQRLNNSLFQKVNLDELYHDLDQRYQKTKQLSAVDVDIFANATKDDLFIDELLDLVHKLRLTAETGNTLSSTPHAVVRTLLQHNKSKELLEVIDDRLNYGVFVDNYTGCLLLDTFWKQKDFVSGARIASQFMLQEDFSHLLVCALSLIHCYNYLLKPEDWPRPVLPEEPEDEVKVRVRYIRNPYDDEHFDLRDPNKIVGKTLIMLTKGRDDSLSKSFNIIGLTLFGKLGEAKKIIKECETKNLNLYQKVIELLPEEHEIRKELSDSKTIPDDVNDILKSNVVKSYNATSEKDIANQCVLFNKWENERIQALEEQRRRLSTAERLAEIEELKVALKERETKLWFFENQEKIELKIEAKSAILEEKKEKDTSVTSTTPTTKKGKIDESYIPPEIKIEYSTNK